MELAVERPPLQAGEVELRPSEFLVLVNRERLHLTVRELELLTALMERRDRIVTREELYREVWDEPYPSPTAHTHFGLRYRFAAGPER